MAQQDKTDWYWNGVLAGAINNLYYDLINVDVCHVPYATNHRNSSFFLKTRLAYKKPNNISEVDWWEIKDAKIIWDNTCEDESWHVYLLWKKWRNKAIFSAEIENWCVWEFTNCTEECDPREFYDDCPEMTQSWCWDWRLFVTNFVKWERKEWLDIVKRTWSEPIEPGQYTWIQINKYNLWTTLWYFSDEYVENWEWEFDEVNIEPWDYLLVYESANTDISWFAWQVRMITWFEESDWVRRLTVDSPWLWFKVIDTKDFKEGEEKTVKWRDLSYAVFKDWGEVIWFTSNNKIYLLPDPWKCEAISPYYQWNGREKTKIIWVADANDKIFVLTDNWYIHYSKEWIWYNKFFIDDDMFAWVDKIAITAYRDMVLAFGRNHISIWVPDEQNRFWTMYNQSSTIWLWSRYSFAEYDWDLIFVSNDKRLLALWVAWTAWRYMLQHEDVWDRLNWKLAALVPWDEVYVWSDENNLRVFVNTSWEPYKKWSSRWQADLKDRWINTQTHIYKFDTLFKVRSEDHILWNLMQWAAEWVYYWEWWIYIRNNSSTDEWNNKFNVNISAYLIENENNWLDNRPSLFQLAKLNRLVTTLWPGIYSDTSKIKITTYSKWIGYTYEYPINWNWNDWVWLITSYYLEEDLTEEEREKIECMLSTLQDSQKQYQPNCPEWKVMRQYIVQNSPWCSDYNELLTESHWVCINDKLYELAPTMPLVTEFGENQQYSTQIKIELIWWQWDIICFGWWLAELFIAPLFMKWPDWEYQLQPNTDCD